MPPDLPVYYPIAAVLAGVVIGSFLNVCIYRIPRDLSTVAPRSFCPECGKAVAWYDNIPLLSYVLLRGKCRYCALTIPLRYPVVELSTAVLFGGVVIRYGWNAVALKWIVFEALLVVLFWTDFEEQILPDELTIGGSAVALIFAMFVMVPGVFAQLLFPGWRPVWRSLLNAGLGCVFLALPVWTLGVLYERLRKREGLGFGDVKLLALFGVFLGLENGVLALLMGAVGGSLVGLAYVLLARKKFVETELPFGSFLCAAAAFLPFASKLGETFRPW